MYSKRIVQFKHNDLVDLEVKLMAFGAGIICVDSVYSGYGSVAHLDVILFV